MSNENSNENITFFLEEKDNNKTDDDQIQKMMNELNEHINAAELDLNLNPWIINDDAEEDINPFFNGALLLYKEYNIKDLLKICNYYGIEKNLKLLKSKKQQIIHALLYFESLPDNFEIVQKRYRMWECIAELLNDSKMKKYVIF
jgi:septum formation inhibitor MinC